MASAPIAMASSTVAAAVRIRVVEFEDQRLPASAAPAALARAAAAATAYDSRRSRAGGAAGGDIGGQRGRVSSADQLLEELCLPPPRPRPFKRSPRQQHPPAAASATTVSSLDCSGSGSGVSSGRFAAGLDADTVRGLLDCLSTQRSLPDDGGTAAAAAEASSGGAPSTDHRARRHHRKLRRVGFAPMTWRRRLLLGKGGVGGGDGADSSGKDDGGGGGRDLRLLYPLFRSRDSLCVTAAAAARSMLLPILVVHSSGGCAPNSIVYGAAPPSMDISPSTELAPTVRGLFTAATSSQPPPPPPPSARNAGRPSLLAAAVVKTAFCPGRGAVEASRTGVGAAGAELGLILARASSFADTRSGRSWRRPAAVQSGGASPGTAALAIGRRGASPARRHGDGGLRVDPSPLPLSARPRAGGALGDEIASAAHPQTSFALSSTCGASGGGGGSSRVAEALDAVRRAQLLGDGVAEEEKDTATNDSEEQPQQRRQLKTQAAAAADGAFPPPTAVGNRRPGSGRWAHCRDGATRELTLVRVVLPTFSAASATAAAVSELSMCETRCASSAFSAT